MAVQHQRLAAAIALEPRDDLHAPRVDLHQLRIELFAPEQLMQKRCDLLFFRGEARNPRQRLGELDDLAVIDGNRAVHGRQRTTGRALRAGASGGQRSGGNG
jgi:hypothetical protein